jgi:hypothetical protein
MTVLSLSWDGMNSGENIVHQVLSSSSSDSIVSNNNNNNNNPVASVATATAAATAAATATPPIATTTDPSKHSELLTAAANDFNYFMGVEGILERSSLSFPDELKILSILIVIFLFLLFLIMLLWDRYGKEIGQLYTPNGIILTTKHHARGKFNYI